MNQQYQNPEEGVDAIKQYSIDLTELAEKSKIDPVIGRDAEIRRIIQILSRRNKNNPVLIGEPGTGKTTVIEGLAKRIIEGDIPTTLRNKKLVALDLSAMLAGAMYRGQFEERLKNFIKQVVESDGEIIVFIDELHTIVGAGAVEGQMDVSNMIKPELARGRMKVIGATTLKEYQKYIEKDAALERRFQQVYIAEPSVEDTVTILRGIKDRYELHHGIRIQDSALIAAANLSNRYISDRFLPDKAVDLVDEAAAKLKMEIHSAPLEIDEANRKLLHLQIEREALKKEKDTASITRLDELENEIANLSVELDELNAAWNQEKKLLEDLQKIKTQIDSLRNQAEQAQRESDFQRVAKIQYNDIPLLNKELDKLNKLIENNHFIKLEVEPVDIADIVSRWTGIPVNRMLQGEKDKVLHLETHLKKRVVGQDEAVKRVADVIRMSKTGVIQQDKPLGSFLFMGNTGVGKTELARSLAFTLFDDEKALVRLDMSEYMESHSVSKMIGAPPGYVGYDEGGQLTEKIRRRPYSVLLFDEIEKAHRDVLNMLLQILDDGRLTDAKGRTVNFKNTVIIMTSNLKQEELNLAMRPELLNRIDEIIRFKDISPEVLQKIVNIRLEELKDRMKRENISVRFSESVYDFLSREGFDAQFGARPVQRLIKREILAEMAKFILQNSEADALFVDYRDEKIVISKERALFSI
ncbi:MAG TPA: AAA family ATPase [Candidatus Marinimicrobia bacterium]|nr:AAA family ATPase [Candidatus Neomarinimicrobiota bacterium]